jgi:ABC-type polysaccharide/polyol phosphate export permease
MAFGMIFYHVGLPKDIGIFLLSIFAGSVTFSLLGIVVATFVPNVEAGPPVINGIILPLYFISGTFYMVPTNSLIAKIAQWFPVRPFIMATFNSYQNSRYVPSHFDKGAFLTLGIWTIVCALIAIRRINLLGMKKQ